jgi:hypothetical protein
LRTLRGHRPSVRNLAFAPDGRTLAAHTDFIGVDEATGKTPENGGPEQVCLWEVGTGRLFETHGTDGLALSPRQAALGDYQARVASSCLSWRGTGRRWGRRSTSSCEISRPRGLDQGAFTSTHTAHT